MSVCLAVYMSIYLSVCLYVCLYASLSVCLSIYLDTCYILSKGFDDKKPTAKKPREDLSKQNAVWKNGTGSFRSLLIRQDTYQYLSPNFVRKKNEQKTSRTKHNLQKYIEFKTYFWDNNCVYFLVDAAII